MGPPRGAAERAHRTADAANAIADPAARAAAVQKVRAAAPPAPRRVFVGKNADRSAAVSLADAKGNSRLVLKVSAAGDASIEFLDESGAVRTADSRQVAASRRRPGSIGIRPYTPGMRKAAAIVIALVLAGFTIGAGERSAAQPRRLKVHISVDMEGVAGAVTGDQLGPTGFEDGRFREFMTREANAAIEAREECRRDRDRRRRCARQRREPAHRAVAADVRVDSIVAASAGMVAGVDNKVDAAIFIGYHAGTNNLTGVRAHTFSSANLTRVALNGVNVTEGSWNAAIAGQFGVPVIMMSGDDAAIYRPDLAP